MDIQLLEYLFCLMLFNYHPALYKNCHSHPTFRIFLVQLPDSLNTENICFTLLLPASNIYNMNKVAIFLATFKVFV
jgi:hypothetical protein